MNALQINQYKQSVHLKDVPIPKISADQLLIEVSAASVNPVDYKIQQGDGKWLLGNHLPLTLGHDFSGVVKEVGEAVQGYQVGDRVFGRAPRTGSFCEYLAVGENDLALAPTSISLVDAAAVPLVALTAWQGLVEGVHLQAGQTILITGGSGGVGSAAIALAHSLGATVTTTASEQGQAFLAAYQPEQVINYQTTDFKQVVKDVDAGFDTRGGQTLADVCAVVKPKGKIATIVALPTKDFAKKIGLNKGAQVLLQVLNYKNIRRTKQRQQQFYAFFTQSNSQQLAHIAKLIDEQKFPVIVEQKFSMKDGQAAINQVKKGHVKGKVIIVVKEDAGLAE